MNPPQFSPLKVAHRANWRSLLLFNEPSHGLAGRSCLLFNHSQDFRLFKNTYWVVVSSNSIPIPDSSPTACMPAVYWSCVQLIHQEWGKEKRIWQGASTLTGVFADIVGFAHFPLAQPYPRPHTYFTPSRNPSTPLAMGLQPVSLNSTSQCGLLHFISIVIWKSARGHQGNIAKRGYGVSYSLGSPQTLVQFCF